ncbi:acyltransferase [Comamonas humi]
MLQHIQILRFAAAMWVALLHVQGLPFFAQLPPLLQQVAAGGYAGVDIFFVISGVIMARSTAGMPHGWRAALRFGLVRFSRIYTGWWPALLLFVAVLGAAHRLPPNVGLLASALLYPTNFTHHISPVIWTLVFELYFYALIAASLLLPPAWRDRVLGLLFAALVLSIGYHHAQQRFAPEMFEQAGWLLMLYASPLVAEFLLGYFLYRFVQVRPRQRWGLWATAAVALGACAVVYAQRFVVYEPGLSGFFHWPERALLIGTAATALVGMALALAEPRSRVLLALARLGDYSFAIYLLHMLVYWCLALLWAALPAALQLRGPMTLLALALVVLASALYYHWVEHPLYLLCRNQISRWLAPRP